MAGSDYKTPPPNKSGIRINRGAPNQVREKLFGGVGLFRLAGSLSHFSGFSLFVFLCSAWACMHYFVPMLLLIRSARI